LVYGFGDGCGGILPKHKTIVTRSLQYVFTTKTRQILGFIADGTGVSSVLVQMFGLWFWGWLRGNIAKNTKPLLCGDCNMFLTPKLEQTLGF